MRPAMVPNRRKYFMIMTFEEIRRSYREAKYPEKQIRILSELNECRVSDIKAVLNGVAVSAHKRYNKTSDREKRRLYEKGLNDCEISSALGITPQAVFYWRQKNELPPNRKGRRE